MRAGTRARGERAVTWGERLLVTAIIIVGLFVVAEAIYVAVVFVPQLPR